MPNDGQKFRIDLDKWIEEEVPKKVVKLQRRIVAEALTGIVMMTPVGDHRKWKSNIMRARRAGMSGRKAGGGEPLPRGYVGGHARKNWQVRIGSRVVSEKPGTDKSGQTAIDTGINVAASIRKPTVAYIINPLPYMDALEHGHSRQAPQGMVRQTVARLNSKYRRVKE